jgi:hypothetical protein
MKLERSWFALLAAFVAADLSAATPVPAPLQGNWVPASASCSSPVRMQVAATSITLVNGADKQTLGGIEMAGPGYFPPDYRGIQSVLITEFDGHQPVTVIFNAGEKKGVAQADFSPVMPGQQTPHQKAYNAHIGKLNLAKRFPIDKAALKRCG